MVATRRCRSYLRSLYAYQNFHSPRYRHADVFDGHDAAARLPYFDAAECYAAHFSVMTLR